MAVLCCPSPWSVMAELKLGQNIHRNSVPVRQDRQSKCRWTNTLTAKMAEVWQWWIQKVRYPHELWITLKHWGLKDFWFYWSLTYRSWQKHQSGTQIQWDVCFGVGLVGRGPRIWPNRSILRKREWPWSHQNLCTVGINSTPPKHNVWTIILTHWM